VDMILTGGGGNVRNIQRRLDGGRLTAIILSAGGQGSEPGPFCLQLEWIKWIQNIKAKPKTKGEDEDEDEW